MYESFFADISDSLMTQQEIPHQEDTHKKPVRQFSQLVTWYKQESLADPISPLTLTASSLSSSGKKTSNVCAINTIKIKHTTCCTQNSQFIPWITIPMYVWYKYTITNLQTILLIQRLYIIPETTPTVPLKRNWLQCYCRWPGWLTDTWQTRSMETKMQALISKSHNMHRHKQWHIDQNSRLVTKKSWAWFPPVELLDTYPAPAELWSRMATKTCN